MTTVSHELSRGDEGRTPLLQRFGPPEVWPSLAISVIWLSVLFDAVFGPDIVTSTGGGTDTSSVPSAVAVALFAFLATWVVAGFGFKRARKT